MTSKFRPSKTQTGPIFGMKSVEMHEVKKNSRNVTDSVEKNETRLRLNYFETKRAKSNRIRTTKYKWYSFIFEFIFEQFERATNVFQLISAAFNLIPGAGVVTPLSSFSALIFVIGIAAVREVLEDISRAKFDRESSRQLYEVIRSGKRLTVFSANILEGDVLIIRDGQEVPVDGVLIYSSEASKQAHVTTASIDGESNLKNRGEMFSTHINDNEDDMIRQFSTLKARIVVQRPTAIMSDFNGKIAMTTSVERKHLSDSSYDGEKQTGLGTGSFGSKSFAEYIAKAGAHDAGQNCIDLTEASHFVANNCFFRGMRLMNTKFALLGVIYVSNDTKIMQNQLPSDKKTSRIESRTNEMIMIMGVVCILLTVSFTITSMTLRHEFFGMASYGNESGNGGYQVLQRFVESLLISVYLLPVSMYITIEFARFFEAAIIGVDEKLRRWDVFSWMLENKNRKLKESPYQGENIVEYQAVVKNSIAVENLAEADIIFSDKTGTLTKNEMTFNSFISSDLKRVEVGIRSIMDETTLFALALCNTVIPIIEKDQVSFEGESPDEIAFVHAAGNFGLELFERNLKHVFYDYKVVQEEEIVTLRLKYKILAVIPFTSTRKRMSIVLREVGTAIEEDMHLSTTRISGNIFFGTPSSICAPGKPFILTKGADSLVLPLTDIISRNNDALKLQQHIDDFSKRGLRTLIFAGRELLDDTALSGWLSQFDSIQQLNELDERYIDHIGELERDLQYICVSAIEDELQDHLQETLSAIVEAKIKLWMLTGDKTLTAINIAKAAGLTRDTNYFTYFTKDAMEQLVTEYPQENEEETANLMLSKAITHQMTQLSVIEKGKYQHELNTVQKLFNKPKTLMSSLGGLFRKPRYHNFPINQTIVLDSDVFRIFMKYNIEHRFFFIAYNAQSVVCCRLSPEEKALLVQLCRHIYPHTTTLAVGDGANDTVMIKAAHIGVGVAGKEGMHACNNSDITVPSFKFLKRLIFFHGRTAHFRNAYLVDYCIYKSSIVAFVNLLYAFESAISGQIVTETFILSLYNTFITFFPVLWYSLTEKDAYEKMCDAYPESFVRVHSRYLPNFKSVWINIIYGLYCSIVMYYGLRFLFSGGNILESGLEMDLYGFETVIAVILSYVACLRVYINTKIYNYTVLCLLVVSLAILYIVVLCGNWFTGFGLGLQGQMFEMFSNLSWYTIACVIVIASLAPLVAYEAYVRLWRPHISDVMLPSTTCGCVEEATADLGEVSKYDEIVKILEIYEK